MKAQLNILKKTKPVHRWSFTSLEIKVRRAIRSEKAIRKKVNYFLPNYILKYKPDNLLMHSENHRMYAVVDSCCWMPEILLLSVNGNSK